MNLARWTRPHTNALCSIGVLGFMFLVCAGLLLYAISQPPENCAASSIVVPMLGLMTACVAAATWVAKRFVQLPDEQGRVADT